MRLRNAPKLANELTTPQEWREAFCEYMGSMAGIDGITDTDTYRDPIDDCDPFDDCDDCDPFDDCD